MTGKSKVMKKYNFLYSLYIENSTRPFPYEDCRKISKRSEAAGDDFIPTLTMYLANIAGYCDSSNRMLMWDNEKLLIARHSLEKTFFDKYSKFRLLETLITSDGTPDLYKKLVNYEKARKELLHLIDNKVNGENII
jgi:hypothetical protein